MCEVGHGREGEVTIISEHPIGLYDWRYPYGV